MFYSICRNPDGLRAGIVKGDPDLDWGFRGSAPVI
jgi:hypothetical protein